VFELILKSAVRIHEHDHTSHSSVRQVLTKLRDNHIKHNSLSGWNKVLNSPYFVSFAKTLSIVTVSHNSPASHTL
jgi:hypothetical protein